MRDLFGVSRHFLIDFTARSNSFVHGRDVDPHRHEHHDGGPESPIAVNPFLWRVVLVLMVFAMRVFVVSRHALKASKKGMRGDRNLSYDEIQIFAARASRSRSKLDSQEFSLFPPVSRIRETTRREHASESIDLLATLTQTNRQHLSRFSKVAQKTSHILKPYNFRNSDAISYKVARLHEFRKIQH